MMSRREELLRIIGTDKDNQILFADLVDEILFIEENLKDLKKLPFISVNPRNNKMQKTTPAAKQYKEFLQQYANCLKLIAKGTGQDLDDDESPLRKWAKKKLEGGG